MKGNSICELFGVRYPIIQGGMVWCSGWELASAVSNAGGLGLIGAGSMYPDVLRGHIQKCKSATNKPFGVNLPLLYPDIDQHIQIILEEKIKIVFTSAGNPKTWTKILKDNNVTVVHVVSSSYFALKASGAGVDAIVAEGFEAGGHNGREETTTLCLVPMVRKVINIPLIAAGGIASGEAIVSMVALGADAVQIGSLFAASKESSAHIDFKQKIIDTQEGGTQLSLKQLAPVRLIKNEFYEQIQASGQDKEVLKILLGKGRAKKGMFEGDMTEGELEIGQVSGMIDEIKDVKQIFNTLIEEYEKGQQNILDL